MLSIKINSAITWVPGAAMQKPSQKNWEKFSLLQQGISEAGAFWRKGCPPPMLLASWTPFFLRWERRRFFHLWIKSATRRIIKINYESMTKFLIWKKFCLVESVLFNWSFFCIHFTQYLGMVPLLHYSNSLFSISQNSQSIMITELLISQTTQLMRVWADL